MRVIRSFTKRFRTSTKGNHAMKTSFVRAFFRGAIAASPWVGTLALTVLVPSMHRGTLATAAQEKEVKEEQRFRFTDGVLTTTSIAFSHDSRYLLAAAGPKTVLGVAPPIPDIGEVRIWDLQSAHVPPLVLKHTLAKGFNRSILVASSPKGSLFASVEDGVECTLRVWSLPQGREVANRGELPWATSLSFSPDGKSIAIGTSKEVIVVDAKTCAIQKRIPHTVGGFNSWLSFSPDGRKILFSGFLFRRVLLMDIEKEVIYDELKCTDEMGAYSAVHWSKDGKNVVLVNSMASISFTDLATKKSVKAIAPLRLDISHRQTLSVSPDDRYLALGSMKDDTYLWDTQTLKSSTLTQRRLPVFSADGKRFASFDTSPPDPAILVVEPSYVLKNLK
jgi:WD40 repeat protein